MTTQAPDSSQSDGPMSRLSHSDSPISRLHAAASRREILTRATGTNPDPHRPATEEMDVCPLHITFKPDGTVALVSLCGIPSSRMLVVSHSTSAARIPRRFLPSCRHTQAPFSPANGMPLARFPPPPEFWLQGVLRHLRARSSRAYATFSKKHASRLTCARMWRFLLLLTLPSSKVRPPKPLIPKPLDP